MWQHCLAKNSQSLYIIKFLAIIFMVLIHTYEFPMDNLEITTALQYKFDCFVEFVGGPPAAPVFMMCLGAGVVFSRKSTPELLRKRAGMLFLVGLLVNIFEAILPIIWENPTWADFIEWLPGLLATDMYYFAGLVFLVFSFIVGTKKPTLTCIIVILVSFVLNFLTNGITFSLGNVWLDILVGLFMRINEYSYFPLINWLPIALAGYLFGKLLLATNDKNKLYIKLIVVGALSMIVTTLIGELTHNTLAVIDPECTDYAYYALGVWSVIWSIGFVLVFSGIVYFITKIYDFSQWKIVKFSNKNIMTIYCTQWLLLSLLIPIITPITNIYMVYVATFMVYILTFIVVYLFNKLKSMITAIKTNYSMESN